MTFDTFGSYKNNTSLYYTESVQVQKRFPLLSKICQSFNLLAILVTSMTLQRSRSTKRCFSCTEHSPRHTLYCHATLAPDPSTQTFSQWGDFSVPGVIDFLNGASVILQRVTHQLHQGFRALPQTIHLRDQAFLL